MSRLRQDLYKVILAAREKHAELAAEEIQARFRLDDLAYAEQFDPDALGKAYGELIRVRFEMARNQVHALLEQEAIRAKATDSGPSRQMPPPPEMEVADPEEGSVWDQAEEAAWASGGTYLADGDQSPIVIDYSDDPNTPVQYSSYSRRSPGNWCVTYKNGGSISGGPNRPTSVTLPLPES